MPLLHCTACHHEYEGPKDRHCNWCGAEGRVLDEETDLERMMSDTRFMERTRALMRQLEVGREAADRVWERRKNR